MIHFLPQHIHSSEQAKRVLAARMMSLTPYIFTNNFALEHAWEQGFPSASSFSFRRFFLAFMHSLFLYQSLFWSVLRKLVSQRCRTSHLLERIYQHAHESYPASSSSSSSSSVSAAQAEAAALISCGPGQAVSTLDAATARAACQAVDADPARMFGYFVMHSP